MSRRIMGRAYYLGAERGGMAYFIKYCDCGKEIYLEGEEFYTFVTRVRIYIPSIKDLIIRFMRHNWSLPKIRVEWKTKREEEIEGLNENRELSPTQFLPIRGFDMKYFDVQYANRGGTRKLMELAKNQIDNKGTYADVGRHFGFSREYARRVCRVVTRTVDKYA